MTKKENTSFFISFNQWGIFFIFSLVISSCDGNYGFEKTFLKSEGVNSFKYQQMTTTFRQERLDNNHTSLDFKIIDDEGFDINNLTQADLRIYENDIPIRNYRLIENSKRISKDLDIVFVLDVTGSMQKTIDKVKTSITNFVTKLEKRNYKANLCVLTFKDRTLKLCKRWKEDDPSTPENENLNAFIAELSRLKAKGGGNPKENSLGALKDAATKTNWHTNTRRIVIMFTDIGSWVMPVDRHQKEAYYAPEYPDVLTALTESAVTAFVISPKWHGYSKNYFKYPSVVSVTEGLFFDFKELKRGNTTIDKIFEQISNRFSSVYTINYISEENVGLNPNLPLQERRIRVEVNSSVYFQGVEYLTKRSNMKNGKPSYESEWPLINDRPINKKRVHVEINSKTIHKGYSIQNGHIVFHSPPPPGAEIKVTYEYLNLKENLEEITPIKIVSYPETLSVYLNNELADSTNYEVIEETDEYWLIKLKDKVFKDADPFNIRGFKRLDVKVELKS